MSGRLDRGHYGVLHPDVLHRVHHRACRSLSDLIEFGAAHTSHPLLPSRCSIPSQSRTRSPGVGSSDEESPVHEHRCRRTLVALAHPWLSENSQRRVAPGRYVAPVGLFGSITTRGASTKSQGREDQIGNHPRDGSFGISAPSLRACRSPPCNSGTSASAPALIIYTRIALSTSSMPSGAVRHNTWSVLPSIRVPCLAATAPAQPSARRTVPCDARAWRVRPRNHWSGDLNPHREGAPFRYAPGPPASHAVLVELFLLA